MSEKKESAVKKTNAKEKDETAEAVKKRIKKESKNATKAVMDAFMTPLSEGSRAPKPTQEWKDLDKKGKVNYVLGWVFLALCIVYVVLVLNAKNWFGNDNYLAAITDSTLINSDNIYFVRMLSSLYHTLFIVGIAKIIIYVIRFSQRFMNRKGLTISKLVSSAIRYISILVLVFVILAVWGIDTATILASAGIVALIVGLGAQSMIADILGGLAIVFEEQFEVGDIVIVDDFRGTVYEIGLTATKIVDAAGNRKTIKNSQISTSINLSHDVSSVIVDIPVDYDTDLRKVRELVSKALPDIARQVPNLKAPITYLGVQELQDSGICLRFLTKADESDKFGVSRLLNELLFTLFKNAGIQIPYPQIVVSQRK